VGKKVKTDMLGSIGRQSKESVESVVKKKDLQQRKVLSLRRKSEGAMDDECGEI